MRADTFARPVVIFVVQIFNWLTDRLKISEKCVPDVGILPDADSNLEIILAVVTLYYSQH